MLNENSTYYDILDVKPDASPEEVREAYLRVKSAYNKDSVALYTLISSEEVKDTLQRIEEAYEVLSTPEKRREYDRHHGLLDLEEDIMAARPPSNTRKKIISIDRVPPMETGGDSEDLLIPPATDFPSPKAAAKASPFETDGSSYSMIDPLKNELFGENTATAIPRPSRPREEAPTRPAPASAEIMEVPSKPAVAAAAASTLDASLAQQIAEETEWHGNFLKRVREARRVSIEEMAETTRITKAYILAIEEENFAKLPAAVFVRGFINQIARNLRLPQDKVVKAFMERYKK